MIVKTEKKQKGEPLGFTWPKIHKMTYADNLKKCVYNMGLHKVGPYSKYFRCYFLKLFQSFSFRFYLCEA